MKYFGQDVAIVLEVLNYPQERVEPELVAWIQATDDVATALSKFDAFEDDWLLDHMPTPESHFNFNLEFK
jgi:hypothetical protein